MIRLLALVALLCALAGCATAPDAVAPAASSPGPVMTPSVEMVAAPVAVEIPAIGASSDLVALGLDAGGVLEVPPVDQPGQAGWFAEGVTPGAVGPAVVVGHVSGRVDGVTAEGVFARLDELIPGDDVLIDTAAGDRQRWVVTAVEEHPKDEFPTAAVYGDTAGPALRLVTCGGDFDPAAGSYRSNVVVWAVPT